MKIMISTSDGNSLINFQGDLIKDMTRRGHEVVCTSVEPEAQMKDRISSLGANYYCIPYKKKGINLISSIKIMLNYITVYRLLKPDLCFLFMSKQVVLGGLASIYCHIKHIVVFVTSLDDMFYSAGIMQALIRFILKIPYKIAYKKSETVFFMNHDDYRKMMIWKLVNKKQSVVMNGSGVNMDFFEKKPMPKSDVVCMTARHLWSRGVREYRKAAEIVRNKYPEVRFLLVGGIDEKSGEISEKELDEAVEKGIIYYCGYSKDIRHYLEVCSIYVLPSYQEGNGRSIMEAEAIGRPIITTKAPGSQNTVIDGYNGFLIPPRDEAALADKIIMLLENQELKRNMAQNSYQLCCKKFDVKKINEILLKRMHLL